MGMFPYRKFYADEFKSQIRLEFNHLYIKFEDGYKINLRY